MAAAAAEPSAARQALLLAWCVAGIYAAYLTQGYVQERISTAHYGGGEAGGERFAHLTFLNLAQAAFGAAWSGAGMVLRGTAGKAAEGSAPGSLYWRAALTNTVGPSMGLAALRNISYPAQVLAKSCKMVPVMIMGTLIGGKRYSAAEYVSAGMIAAGVSVFALAKSSKAALSKLQSPNAMLGYTLCALNLAFDGYTNAYQEKLVATHPKTSSQQMMFWMNAWCSLYYAIYMFGFSTVGPDAVAFCARHPDAARDVLMFCVGGAVGQSFIFLTIASFGALINTTITTTRKFVNICISVAINGTVLKGPQWAGVALVFGGVALSSYVKQMRKKKHTE